MMMEYRLQSAVDPSFWWEIRFHFDSNRYSPPTTVIYLETSTQYGWYFATDKGQIIWGSKSTQGHNAKAVSEIMNLTPEIRNYCERLFRLVAFS